MTDASNHLFVFGPGYTAGFIMEKAIEAGWTVSATCRSDESRIKLEQHGINAVAFDSGILPDSITHILTSVAPKGGHDAVLDVFGNALQQTSSVKWIGYLSSTNVYGDHAGDWVDENTVPTPSLERGHHRLDAEQRWQQLAASMGASINVFRLAGIYGPGRNAIRTMLDGRGKRVIKQGQVFSRIHVDDIAQAVWYAMTGSSDHEIFNLADDMAAPPQDVIEYAAKLLGMPIPPDVPFETADLSPMARSFYMESKRVRNDRIKSDLGVQLKYPDFKVALKELLETETKA